LKLMAGTTSLIANLPPLPGEEPPQKPKPSHTAYVLRGSEWVEIGTATPHKDGKGHQLRLDLAPGDGEIIELRALDPEHFPRGRGPAAGKRRSPTPRIGAFSD
jgi:hypothetical protein